MTRKFIIWLLLQIFLVNASVKATGDGLAAISPPYNPLPKIRSSGAYFVYAFQCERRCEHVYEEVRELLSSDKPPHSELALRYLQVRFYEQQTSRQKSLSKKVPVIGWGILPVAGRLNRLYTLMLDALTERIELEFPHDKARALKTAYWQPGQPISHIFRQLDISDGEIRKFHIHHRRIRRIHSSRSPLC